MGSTTDVMRCDQKSRLGFLVIGMIMPCMFLVTLDAASPTKNPEVYVRLTFNIAWGRFCYLAPLFKHRLSDILIEERDGLVYLIPPSRIHIINADKECESKHGNIKLAVVDFYVASHGNPNKVDKKYTEQSFSILFHYWEAKRMVLLGPTFELMVDNVEIKGEGSHKFPKRLNEGERIGIGIAVGLVVVFALTALYIFMYHRGKSSKKMELDAPPEYPRRHCRVRKVSLISEGTEDISLEDAVEGPSGLSAMARGEPRRTDAPKPSSSEDEEEEEELNIFVAKL